MSLNENEIEKPQPNQALISLRKYLDNEKMKTQLAEVLGKRSGAFASSIVSVVKNSRALQECSADSIMTAAMKAATLALPIDPALGFSAIVPYKNKSGTEAQFQIMYRGIIQLCIRSGQYQSIHDTEVYKDEIESYNPITGEIKFVKNCKYDMRNKGDIKDIAGFYVRFKLVSGFEASMYMTMDQVMCHARKFSKSYQNDIKYKKATSVWSTDPVAMGRKTVIKALLTRYGIQSVEMQDAFIADAVDDNFDTAADKAKVRIEKETGSEVIDVETGVVEEPETETVPPSDDDPEAFLKDE